MELNVFLEMARRGAAGDLDYASLVVLIRACKEVVAAVPETLEQLEQVDQKDLLEDALARLGKAITQVVPYEEFYFYAPESRKRVS